MQSTIEALLNTDNAARKLAEEYIEQLYTSNPLDLAKNLIQGLNENYGVATMSCVLLKKYFLDKRASYYLQPSDLNSLMLAVRGSIETNLEAYPLALLKSKGDVLVRTYINLDLTIDLLSLLSQLMTQTSAKIRQFAMYCFEVLSELNLDFEKLSQQSEAFKQVFSQGLNDGDNNVRVASLKATTAFLSSIEDQTVVLKFVDILDLILRIVIEALKTDEDYGRVALESMSELTNAHPEVWKSPYNLLTVAAEVTRNSAYDDATRSAAVEVILSLSGAMPAVLRKAPETKTLFYPALVSMLTEVEKDNALWEQTEEDTNAVGKDPVSTAVNALVRLSEDLGAKTTLECTQDILKELLFSEDWVKAQAGWTLLGVISSATKDILRQHLARTLQDVAQGVRHPHCRVRYAALGALGHLSTECAPQIYKQFHGDMLPLLLSLMSQEANAKMQTQATSVCLNFVQGLVEADEEDFDGREILAPYTQYLLQTLVLLLKQAIQNKQEPLQSEVLNVLHSVCSVVLSDFGIYFNDFIPMMYEILLNVGAVSMQDKKLRAKTIDTIGSIIIAVSDCDDKAPFEAGVHQVTRMLAEQLQQGLSDDDPYDEAIKNTLTQAAGFLQKQFAPYMEFLTAYLLKDAMLTVDFKLENADAPVNSGAAGFNVKIQGLGEYRVSVKTESLVKKTSAFGLFEQVSDNMGSAFAPYAAQLLPVITSHMTYPDSRQIRKFALKTFRNILVAVGEPQNVVLFYEHLHVFMEQTMQYLNKMDKKNVKLSVQMLAETLKALNEHNDIHREFLSDAQIASLGPLIKRTLDLVTALRQSTKKVIQTKQQNHEIDAEDEEKLKQDLAKVSDVACQVMELTGYLVEIFKNRAYPVVRDTAVYFFARQLEIYQELTEDELLDALCFFCDFVENTDAHKDQAMLHYLTTKFLEISLADPEYKPDFVQQTLCYGFGVFAINVPNGQFPLLAQVVARCKLFVYGADAFSEDRIVCTESTLGALAKIAYMHLDGKVVTNDDLCNVLSKMPFTAFSTEALTSHRLLIEQFKNLTSPVHNSKVLPAATAALKRIYAYSGDKKILSLESKQQLSALKL